MINLSLSFWARDEAEQENRIPAERELIVEALFVELDGSLAFEYDDKLKKTLAKYKIGDGRTSWRSLPYAGVLELTEGHKDLLKRFEHHDREDLTAHAALFDRHNSDANAHGGNILEVLTADRTYYVRKDGNDNNDGLSAATAFATVTKMMQVLSKLDGAGYNVVINLGPGTWTEVVLNAAFYFNRGNTRGIPVVYLNGAGMDQTIIDTGGPFGIVADGGGVTVVADGFKLVNATYGLFGTTGGAINFNNIDFGTTSQTHIVAQDMGRIACSGGAYKISGSSPYGHILARQNSWLGLYNIDVEIAEGLTASNFLNVNRQSGALAALMRFSGGTMTGGRCSVGDSSVVDTYGAGENYFPCTGGVTVSNFGGYYK